MDKLTKIKCWGCGVLLATIISAESLPLICEKCHQVSIPHLPEHNYFYTVGTAVAVSGISDTATTQILQLPDSDTS